MSEREFDAYLKLLGGLLRLSPGQRELIAGELRDHMEERLDALLAAGISREEAIGQALEEFGDVAALATSFRQLAWNRKRRWIMRCTAASVCGVLLVILAAMVFLPNGPSGPGLLSQANAQDQEVTHQPEMKSSEERNAETRAKLEQSFDAQFLDMDLLTTLRVIENAHDLSIYVDMPELEMIGVDVETCFVTLNMPDVRCKMALEIILDRFECLYYLRDGFVVVTSKEKAMTMAELRVYDCEDVLAAVPAAAKAQPGLGSAPAASGANPQSASEAEAPAAAAKKPYIFTSANADTLIEIITRTVDPDSWEMNGGLGSIAEYDGKIVVRQTDAAHAQIKYLLENLTPEYALTPATYAAPQNGGN